MCGIAGLITSRTYDGPAGEVIEAMTAPLRHRGPDDAGIWCDNEAGVALGHRRLSVIDLSPTGHQPMASASGRFVITFNGEIYNYRDLRAVLDALPQPPKWRGGSDTEVLVEAIDRLGVVDTLKRLVGMFAFAVWDRVERKLTLARDRMGEKPLYYGWWRGSFLFGSELRALRGFPGFAPEIDKRALSLYFSLNAVPAPWSIYEGVRKLQPGHVLTLRAGNGPSTDGLTIEPYWRLDDILSEPRFKGSPEDAAEELERLLLEAVRLQMVADVPVGAFLSGGVDSSTVVALMQSISPRPIKTFSLGFREAEFNEAHYAKAVAHHLGADHTELVVMPQDALDMIPRLPVIWDEPFADPSQIPTAMVSALAREHVTVSLSGDGGDELFCGYDRYFGSRLISRLPMKSQLRALLHPRLVPAWVRMAHLLPSRLTHRVTESRLHTVREIIDGDGSLDHYLEMVYQPRLHNQIVPLAASERYPMTATRPPPGLDHMTSISALDAVTYLPDDILTKVDRSAMAVALEGRIPLLDHRIVEFAFRLPTEIKVRNGQTKWPLRSILYKHVPRELIERPKMGFGVPIGEWLRGPLKDWAHSILFDEQDELLDSAIVEQLWREHQAGSINRQTSLWRGLMFKAWRAAS